MTGSAEKRAKRSSIPFLASVKLTVLAMSLIATTVLIGAWCPQISQVGSEKVFEMFGPQVAPLMISWGIADIFHTPWFLFLIALLTVNMVACSFQRVFPKIRLLRQPMPWLDPQAISKMPVNRKVELREESDAFSRVVETLRKKRYSVHVEGEKARAEYGKIGRLAATVTHIGLLTLLAGVTVTSWTGFNGFQAVAVGNSMSFASSQHSRLWIGRLPDWQVRVDKSSRENYPTGEPKQWYSDLSVVDRYGRVLKSQQISVNNPLSYEGVDVYQATWGLESIKVSFSGNMRSLSLQPMGKRHAAFLPLDGDSILIFSVLDQTSPLRLFAKRSDWQAPRMLKEIAPGGSADLGGVQLVYKGVVPVSGLQYKSDPGLPIVYFSFFFIITGILLASVPHRHVWVALEESPLRTSAAPLLYIGGRSVKAKVGLERLIDSIADSIESQVESRESHSASGMSSQAETEASRIGAGDKRH